MQPTPQGTYLPPTTNYLDSGRFSDVESVETRQNEVSFMPPKAGKGPSERSIFKKPAVFVDETPLEKWDPGSFKVRGFREERKRQRVLRACVLLLLIAVVGAVGFFVVNEQNNQNEANLETNAPTVSPTANPTTATPTLSPTTRTPTNSPTTATPTVSPTESPTEIEDCASLGVTDDEMRRLLADNFDAAIQAGVDTNQVFYNGFPDLVCLPNDAFRRLTDEQKVTLTQLIEGIRISSSGLSIINENAFDPALVSTHRQLNLFNNQLTELPDRVFRHFVGMDLLILSSNPFVQLNNNILGDLPLLVQVSMNTCNDLIEFPEFLRFAPTLIQVEFAPATALVTANARAFEGLVNLQAVIFFNGFTPVLNQFGAEDLEVALEIDANTIAIFGEFCAPFGLNDDVIRQFLADNFDGATPVLNANNEVIRLAFNNIATPCLPENAFSLLSAEQKQTLAGLQGVVLNGLGLQLIHQFAFEADLFGSHTFMDLSQNNLVNLPNRLFESMPNLQILVMLANPFVTLSNNIFDRNTGAQSLQVLALNGCEQIIEFPETMLFTPNLVNLQMGGCTSLSNANSEAFANVNLNVLFLTNAVTPILNQLGLQGLANALGLDVGIFNILQ